jgi:hypothetical protein
VDVVNPLKTPCLRPDLPQFSLSRTYSVRELLFARGMARSYLYTQRMTLRYARVNDVPESIFTKEGYQAYPK